MKNKKIIKKRRDDLPLAVLLDRFEIYNDGCIYDTIDGKDIPQYIFEIKDLLINNNK